MALTISRASLFCTFLGVVVFTIFTISSYVHIHLLLHFRNYTTIHPDIDGGGGDVEVLAYVNSNLIVIHKDLDQHEQQHLKRSSSSSSTISVPSSSTSISSSSLSDSGIVEAKKTLVPKNLSNSVTVVNEAVINNTKKMVQVTKSATVAAIDNKISSKAAASNTAAKIKGKVSDELIVTNFTVDGWPINKSRIATDYIDYEATSWTATLAPKTKFSSVLADDLSQPQVLIAVQSAHKNLELRNEVRRTWGSACQTTHANWCSLIFVLGSAPSYDLQSQLEAEHAEHDDILQEPFVDTYNNLTLKSIHILKYFVRMNANAKPNQFLLKTDDDSFVHLEALWDLAKIRMLKKSNNLIGYLQLGLKKHHYLPLAHKPTKSNLKKDAWLKWLIPTYMYNKRFFPQFLSGSGYLVTRTAAECLLLKSKTIPIVHLEDVYITGLCASSCHLRREHDKGFKARPMDKIAEYKIQLSDVVLHYTTGQMDRFFKQSQQLSQDSLLDSDP